MSAEKVPITRVFAKVVDLAEAVGVTKISQLAGCWEYRIDDKWSLKVNGHREEVDGLPAFHGMATCNEWPASIFSPFSGTVLGGTEDELLEVLDGAIARAKEAASA